jgi:hypothetical protein
MPRETYFDSMVQDALAAIRADPANAELRLKLAVHWYLSGQWELAADLLDRARLDGVDHPGFAELRGGMTGAPSPTPKVFCIGRNKTGLTSLEAAGAGMGYRPGLRRAANG